MYSSEPATAEPQLKPLEDWSNVELDLWLDKNVKSALKPPTIAELQKLGPKKLAAVSNSEDLMDAMPETVARELQWIMANLVSHGSASKNSKKRKADEISGSPIDEPGPKDRYLLAVKVFQHSHGDFEWTNDFDSLKDRLKSVKTYNTIDYQNELYGKALREPLPLAPYGNGHSIFEWYLYNSAPEISSMVKDAVKPQTTNSQLSQIFLIYQVSGAGKTKLAYELSSEGYTVFIRCIDNIGIIDYLKIIFREEAITASWKRLNSNQRSQLPYLALYVVYAWVAAYLSFLEYYQQSLLPAVEHLNLSTLEKQQYFHLLACHGSPVKKFICGKFQTWLKQMNNNEDKNGIELLAELNTEIDRLITITNVKAIIFDELLQTRGLGRNVFAPNQLFDVEVTQAKRDATYQVQMNKFYGGGVTTSEKPEKFDRDSSVVNGVLHFASVYQHSVSIVLADTSRVLQEYYVQKTSPRPIAKIKEIIPEAYLTVKHLWNILHHYFEVDNTQELRSSLKKYEGRAWFFTSRLFDLFQTTLSKKKPADKFQVTKLIMESLNSSNAQKDSLEKAVIIVKDFYENAKEDLTLAVETGISLAAGCVPRDMMQRLSLTLSFVHNNDCRITEPWILQALIEYRRKHNLTPSKDPVLASYATIISKMDNVKDGKLVGKGDILEVLVARCLQLHYGQEWNTSFGDLLEFSGLTNSFVAKLRLSCSIAGTITNFQKYDENLMEFDLENWLGRHSFVFPSTLMKPDGIAFLSDTTTGEEVLCLFQMRFYAKPLTPADLVQAVETLNPNNFYNKKKSYDINTRNQWLDSLKRSTTQKFFHRFVRVVVSGQGFTEDAIALVKKYNLSPVAKTQSIILWTPSEHLFGPAVLAALKIAVQRLPPPKAASEDARVEKLVITLPQVEELPAANAPEAPKVSEGLKSNLQRTISDFFMQALQPKPPVNTGPDA